MPPASGSDAAPDRAAHGASDRYLVAHEPLDVGALIAAATTPPCGAVATFVGTVRSPNHGREVASIDYQGYEAMLVPEMETIGAELRDRYDAHRIVIAHRVGRLVPGEASIAIVVATPHRDAAFAACRAALELCKERLPIWKHETDDRGTHWVDGVSRAAPTL